MSKPPVPAVPPIVVASASQKSAGKTHLTTFIADAMTVNDYPFRAFQIDDQKRFTHMIGNKVVDLRPDPSLLIDDPTLAMRALTPFYDAARMAPSENVSVLLDSGANEVENFANFLRDVGFGDDVRKWKLPFLAFVPFLALDPESTSQSAFTVRRLLEAAPGVRVVLVENRFGGAVANISANSFAEANYRELLAVAKGCEYIVMPAIAREYWAPFEGAGVRFIKALAMDPDEGARLFGRSAGEVKIMKSAVARFWRTMHEQMSRIIHLPKGGK